MAVAALDTNLGKALPASVDGGSAHSEEGLGAGREPAGEEAAPRQGAAGGQPQRHQRVKGMSGGEAGAALGARADELFAIKEEIRALQPNGYSLHLEEATRRYHAKQAEYDDAEAAFRKAVGTAPGAGAQHPTRGGLVRSGQRGRGGEGGGEESWGRERASPLGRGVGMVEEEGAGDRTERAQGVGAEGTATGTGRVPAKAMATAPRASRRSCCGAAPPQTCATT